ncbi:hypothetical protein BDP81DRAFT_449271 [Colletotrichum phormii]|uniref:BRCT domain-containing protein n=1 Tax=Colletotrichum phormii TaxID=359342 RepID=A0AAI9ZV55_9PEZI|nr:uncharacterized protein BDP81DRAFT_449271 [Colletotrichum phormii]KAK1637202.1 hypothetical protein BDP81DRAFT_449271 [Colletotrichum phormii]
MVAAIFKDLVITTAEGIPDDFTRQQVFHWTNLRSGEFSRHLSESTTHLLFTNEEFESAQKHHRIKEAERRSSTKGAKNIHILHWKWFRDSCIHNKKLPMEIYRYDTMKTKAKKEAEAEVKRARAADQAYRWIRPEWYSVAKDSTSFKYKVDLFRSSENEDGALHEKYELYLFRSHSSRPHMYWFGAKLFHKKNDGRWIERGIERPSGCCSTFRNEFGRFVKFFELKTKIRWEDRVIKAGTREKTAFSYSPPTGGKPVGGKMAGARYSQAIRSNKKMLRRYAELFGDELPSDLQIEDACDDILKAIVNGVCASLEMNAKEENGVNNMTEASKNPSLGNNDSFDSDMEGNVKTGALYDPGIMAQYSSDIEDTVMEGHVEGL